MRVLSFSQSLSLVHQLKLFLFNHNLEKVQFRAVQNDISRNFESINWCCCCCCWLAIIFNDDDESVGEHSHQWQTAERWPSHGDGPWSDSLWRSFLPLGASLLHLDHLGAMASRLVRRLLRFESLQAEVDVDPGDDDDGVSQGVSQLPPQLLLLPLSTLGRRSFAVIRDVDHPPDSALDDDYLSIKGGPQSSGQCNDYSGGCGDNSPATGTLSAGCGLLVRQLPIGCVLFGHFYRQVDKGDKWSSWRVFCCCCLCCFFVQSCNASGPRFCFGWLTGDWPSLVPVNILESFQWFVVGSTAHTRTHTYHKMHPGKSSLFV